MAKSFTETMLGDVHAVKLNGVTVGFSKNSKCGITFDYNELWVGIPQYRAGKKKTRDKVELETELYESERAENWLNALGIKDNVLSNTLGSVKTDYWQDAETWQASHSYSLGEYVEPTTLNGKIFKCTTAGTSGSSEPTWDTTVGNTTSDGSAVWTCEEYDAESIELETFNSGSLKYAQLEGYNLSASDVEVYNSSFTTKYTEGTDYFVDTKTGRIFRIPSGSIGATDTIGIRYKYTEISAVKLDLDPQQFQNKYVTVDIETTDPHEGKARQWVIYEAKASGIETQFTSEDFMKLPLKLSARKDSNRENYGYGYIFWAS